MRRFALYSSAAVVVVSLITTTLAVTSAHRPSPLCPRCGAPDAVAGARFDQTTIYTCRACTNVFYGPGRTDFSWMDALEDWLTTEPTIE
jgi:ribosomal protein L37AE/L43A